MHSIGDGIWTAIITPMQEDGSIDWVSFEKLLEKQKNAKVTGVVVSGTTGEAPTLSVQEKLSLIRKAKAYLGSSTQVMAGTGNSNTEQSLELSKLAKDAGADSLLLVTPPYNKPSLNGIKAHFKLILDSVKLPTCLYHVPSRTGAKLSPEALSELLELEGLVAIKEATGEIDYMTHLAIHSDQKTLLSGDDFSYLGALAVGAAGCISVVSNLFPKAMVELTEAFKKGDVQKATHLNKAIFQVATAMFSDSSPSPLKFTLSNEGLTNNKLRLPLFPVDKESEINIQGIISEAKTILKELN